MQALCSHRRGAGHALCKRCSSRLGQRRPDLMQAVRQARKDRDDVAEPVADEVRVDLLKSALSPVWSAFSHEERDVSDVELSEATP